MTSRPFQCALLIAACLGCSPETATDGPNGAEAADRGNLAAPAAGLADAGKREVAMPPAAVAAAETRNVAAPANPRARLPVARTIIFADSRDPVTVAGGGVEVRLRPRKSEDGGIEVDTAVRIPGFPAMNLSEEFGSSDLFERWVGIGKLSARDRVPAVLLGGYTGGAHCCATLRAIVPYRGRLRVLEFEEIDGGPDDPFPQDVNGDGVVDFVRQDDSFRYQFAGGAASFSPPVIFNIRGGRIDDVSTAPSFRPVWQRFAEETRARCSDRSDPQRNGACAAYGAAAARLGRYAQAVPEIDRFADRDLTKPARFTAGLTEFLRSHGYID